jgi:pantothenate synthetase
VTKRSSGPVLPLTVEARERLRNQQRVEAQQLDSLLTAQRRLARERAKAERAIGKAQRAVASRQSEVDAAIVRLVESSGVPRVAVLLGRAESQIAALVRAERRRSNEHAAAATSTVTT